MEPNSDTLTDGDSEEEIGVTSFDLWSDEGAQLYNEILDEGSAYRSTGACFPGDPEADPEDEQRDYCDPEFYDPDEETLSPGDMELIFENCFIS